MRCSCEFNSSNIIDNTFSCRGSQGDFEKTVVFRAMITLPVPASVSDADGIVDLISEWVQSNPSVTVDKVILEIDPDCPAMLESVTSDDCVNEMPPPRQSAPSSSSSSSSLPIGIIIGAVVAGVIVLLLIIIIVVVVMYRRRKSTYRYYAYVNITVIRNMSNKHKIDL